MEQSIHAVRRTSAHRPVATITPALSADAQIADGNQEAPQNHAKEPTRARIVESFDQKEQSRDPLCNAHVKQPSFVDSGLHERWREILKSVCGVLACAATLK